MQEGFQRGAAPLVGKEGIPKGNPSKGFPLAVFRPFLAAERDGPRGLSAIKKLSTKEKMKIKSYPTTGSEKIWSCILSGGRKGRPARPERNKKAVYQTEDVNKKQPPTSGKKIWSCSLSDIRKNAPARPERIKKMSKKEREEKNPARAGEAYPRPVLGFTGDGAPGQSFLSDNPA